MRNNNKLKLKKSIIILMIVLLFFVSSGHIAYAQQINFFSWLKSFKNFISRSLSFFNISNKDTIKNTTQFIFTEKPTEQLAVKTTAGEETESGRLNLPREVQPPNKDYWVYIRTYDKPEVSLGETAGRSKKGDIVQVLDASIYTTPSETEKKEWLIIKVSGLTQEQIETMMQSWQEQTGVNEDGSPIEITKAYRKYKLDIDELKTKEGITIKEGLWQKKIDKTDVINQIELKDKKDISRYYWQSVKYAITKNVTGIKRKIASVFVPRARAATTNTRTVIPAGGGDYASLSLWEDARDGDLVTLDTIEIANCSGATADTTAVVILGWTTAVGNYIEINGDNTTGKWNTNAYNLITLGASPAVKINAGTEHIRIIGLQIKNTANSNWDSGIQIAINDGGDGSSDIRIEKNIIVLVSGEYSSIFGIHNSDVPYDHNTRIINNIIYDCATAGIYIAGQDNASLYVANNTVINSGTGISINTWFSSVSGDYYLYNNISENNTVADYNVAIDYMDGYADNIASDTSSPNNEWDSTDVIFANETAGSEDLHLSDADTSGAKDGGTDLSGIFTDDIDGNTRSGTWDIGADEWIAPSMIIKGGVKIKGGVRIKNNE